MKESLPFGKRCVEFNNHPVNCEQWRIQDFPEEEAPTPEGGANILFGHFSRKLHENEEILDGGGAPP